MVMGSIEITRQYQQGQKACQKYPELSHIVTYLKLITNKSYVKKKSEIIFILNLYNNN